LGIINFMKRLKAIAALTGFLLMLSVSGLQAQKLKPLSNTDEVKSVYDAVKGKVVLVNFWATWCKPCVKEFPELVKLYSNSKDEGFELVFISLDDMSEIDSHLTPFLKKQGVDFTTYYSTFAKPEDLMEYVDKNWQGAIPSTYIYDREGSLKKSILGTKTYEQFEKEITVLLD
jgi:thiol-disulfide isomerase/thioredoxin